MKKEELRKRLEEHKIKKCHYSLEGGLPNEALCLEENDGVWVVYYSERGGKSFPKEFESEDEACDYFSTKILKTRQWLI